MSRWRFRWRPVEEEKRRRENAGAPPATETSRPQNGFRRWKGRKRDKRKLTIVNGVVSEKQNFFNEFFFSNSERMSMQRVIIIIIIIILIKGKTSLNWFNVAFNQKSGISSLKCHRSGMSSLKSASGSRAVSRRPIPVTGYGSIIQPRPR